MSIWKQTKFKNIEVSSTGVVMNTLTGKVLKSAINPSNGYYYVFIYQDGKSIPKAVHRLVAETYLTYDPAMKLVVDHIDGGRLNNDVSNLQWITNRENILKCKKSKPRTRFSSVQKLEIIAEYKTGNYSQISIAAYFNALWGLTKSRKTYTHVLKKAGLWPKVPPVLKPNI